MSSPNPAHVVWTKAHLAELERLFPEQTDFKPDSNLMYRTGQRNVVAYVRTRVNQLKEDV